MYLIVSIDVPDPCQFGGTCTDTDGSFFCACEAGFTGHRCQYSSICETQSPCPSNLTCVPTVINVQGYVCQEVSVTGSVVVTDPATSPSLLDEEVNSLLETQEVGGHGWITCLVCINYVIVMYSL